MYQLIYADPPWRYQNKGVNGAAENHYQTMTLEDMKRLPVWSIAADDAVLCMWFTGTHVDEAKELAKAWGFEVRTMKGLTWVKLNELAWQHIEKRLREQDVIDFHDFLELLNTQTRMNGGTYTRANSEDMLIAVRGAGLERAAMNVKQVVYSCLGEHSQKPAEARYRIEQLYGNVSRIELFSRGDAAGWHHWGNENPFNDIDLVPATFTAMQAARNSRVKAQTGYYQAIAGALQQTQQQNIPENIPTPDCEDQPAEETHEIIEKVMGETEIPLTKELLLAESGIQVWACAAAAFGDKATFTFSESKYAHSWAADSVEQPEFVVVPAETIAKAVKLIRSSSEAEVIRAWVNSTFTNSDAQADMIQRLNTVASEFNEEIGLSTSEFITLMERLDQECCMNIRVLRSKIREVLAETGVVHHDA